MAIGGKTNTLKVYFIAKTHLKIAFLIKKMAAKKAIRAIYVNFVIIRPFFGILGMFKIINLNVLGAILRMLVLVL
jgi:hypothetical protein